MNKFGTELGKPFLQNGEQKIFRFDAEISRSCVAISVDKVIVSCSIVWY